VYFIQREILEQARKKILDTDCPAKNKIELKLSSSHAGEKFGSNGWFANGSRGVVVAFQEDSNSFESKNKDKIRTLYVFYYFFYYHFMYFLFFFFHIRLCLFCVCVCVWFIERRRNW
jgi:hypothetical protein